jgi:hypothetical protein
MKCLNRYGLLAVAALAGLYYLGLLTYRALDRIYGTEYCMSDLDGAPGFHGAYCDDCGAPYDVRHGVWTCPRCG